MERLGNTFRSFALALGLITTIADSSHALAQNLSEENPVKCGGGEIKVFLGSYPVSGGNSGGSSLSLSVPNKKLPEDNKPIFYSVYSNGNCSNKSLEKAVLPDPTEYKGTIKIIKSPSGTPSDSSIPQNRKNPLGPFMKSDQ